VKSILGQYTDWLEVAIESSILFSSALNFKRFTQSSKREYTFTGLMFRMREFASSYEKSRISFTKKSMRFEQFFAI
jgi:hypothetical protein